MPKPIVQIVAPILITLPTNRKYIRFDDFTIRKLIPPEKNIFFQLSVCDNWSRAEINKSEFCLATQVNGNTDYHNINQFQSAVKYFRQALRLIGCTVNLSHYMLGSNAVGSAGVHSQAGLVHNAYNLSNKEIKEIKKIYSNVKALSTKSDSKFEITCARYESSISTNQAHANKFIDAITVLESLILPGKDRGELNTRLAIITSNLLNKYYKFERIKVYPKIREYYDIRSDFVHSGNSAKYSQTKLEDVQEIARQILLLFVNKKNLFEEKNLDGLLIN